MAEDGQVPTTTVGRWIKIKKTHGFNGSQVYRFVVHRDEALKIQRENWSDLTAMLAGSKAKFLRGAKTLFCPHKNMIAAWTAISVTVPSRLLWADLVRSKGRALSTSDLAKHPMLGVERILLSSMNFFIASHCWWERCFNINMIQNNIVGLGTVCTY